MRRYFNGGESRLTGRGRAPSLNSLLLRLGDAAPDGNRLAVLVEAPPSAVDVGVGGGGHGLLAGPDGLG